MKEEYENTKGVNMQADRHADNQVIRQASRETVRSAGRQTRRQTGRQVGRLTDRHTSASEVLLVLSSVSVGRPGNVSGN